MNRIKKCAIAIIVIVFGITTVFSQEKTKISFKATGSVALSYHLGSESAYFNFGGPGIRLDYGKFGISYNMFPSLRFFHGDVDDSTDPYRTKSSVTTILGTGFQLHYKKLAVVLPMYYLPSNNVWIVSAGLGYKL